MNQTPLQKAIAEFQRHKDHARSIIDMLYLDDVISVLESMKEYEKNQIKAAYIAGSKDCDINNRISNNIHSENAEEYFKNTYQ